MQQQSVKRRWMRSAIMTSRRSTGLLRPLRDARRPEVEKADLAQAIEERQKLRRLH